MEFNVYNSVGKKTVLTITNVRLDIGSARLNAEYMGMELKDKLICYGGGHNRPFLRFENSDRKFVDVEFTDEIIEYLWKEIGCPKDSLLYCFTKDYKNNWCD